jgi:formate dehydrogenase subunit gamma
MTPPPEVVRSRLDRDLPRFSRATRWVHRSTAALMGVAMASATALYLEPVAVAVGHRHLVEQVHVWAGLLLPVPLVLGVLHRAVRADVSALNRFEDVDTAWLRARDRRSGRFAVGKFNAGQKLNAALTAGGVLVMLGTGVVMAWPQVWPLFLRTGATFVHDWVAFFLLLLVAGHLWFASRDPVARRGMRTGVVPGWWAQREHRAWADEVGAQPSSIDPG